MEATKTTQMDKITLENYKQIKEVTPKNENEYINFCKENIDKINWKYISKNQILTENFIINFINEVYWEIISQYQKLSEKFIKRFESNVCWHIISKYQKLSEKFIKRFKNRVCWTYISQYQKLSEDFIREFKDYVDWSLISKYQKLSENFILEFKNYLDLYCIAKYQKLSPETIKILNLEIDKDNWLYKDTEFKKNEVIKTGLYEFDGEYFYGYKGIRSYRYSKFNFQYQYLPNRVYETHADFTSEENSFGFSVWTKEMAKEYCDELIIKVRFKPEDVARVLESGKIRVTRLEVLN